MYPAVLPGPVRKQDRPSASDGLRRLISFYKSCVEAEDRRSLTLPLRSRGRSFIAPWTGSEPLLHAGASYIDFSASTEAEESFLRSTEAQAGAAERFFYGFPVRLEQNDDLAPLFFLEVEISRRANGFRLIPIDPENLVLNRHVLGRRGIETEEQQVVEEIAQGSFGSFAARIAAVFEYLGESPGALAGSRIEPLPPPGTREARWLNCPIIFRSAHSAYTSQLRRELDAFLRYPRLLDELDGTALGVFLGRSRRPTPEPIDLIELVPLNREQTEAARAALRDPLTVITGPPGTGKSQVVVDLLASCAAARRAVLFCSKNNKAVDVVRERFRELLGAPHDWTLRLGNRQRVAQTRDEMMERIDAWTSPQPAPKRPDFAEWDRQVELAYRQREQINTLQRELAQAAEALRSAAERIPETWVAATPSDYESRLSLEQIDALRDRAAVLSGQGRIGLWLWLIRLLLPGRLRKRLRTALDELCASLPDVVAADLRQTADRDVGFRTLAEAFARALAYGCWLEARDRVVEIENRLSVMPYGDDLAHRIAQAKRAKAEATRSWLRDLWTARVTSKQAEVHDLLASYFDLCERLRTQKARGAEFAQRLETLAETIRTLGRHLPIWIVTNLSVRRCLPLMPGLFDLVVIDEASQCDIASALPLLFRARRAVIIGDPHQLRHISILRKSEEDELARENSVDQWLGDWSYVDRSLYDLAAQTYRHTGNEPIFLREHFRSWPLIVEFPNRSVYRSRLLLRSDLGRLRQRLGNHSLGIIWHDVRGKVPRSYRSAFNPAEVQAILELLRGWWDSGFLRRADLRFGIVTPFRRQVERIGEKLRAGPWWDEIQERLILGTAHQFQGDECDVMVLSPVVAPGMRERTQQWLTSTEHLLNVAITRARGVLHVVGDQQACQNAGGLLGEFARYVAEMAATSPDAAGNPAQARMAEILTTTDLWYHPQYPVGPDVFDFLIISPFGTRYDLEIDGRQHRTPEAVRADQARDERVRAAGYTVIRLPASDVFQQPHRIRERIGRLV